MNETQFQITASEQRVLQTFREYLMTPGKMLCFSGPSMERHAEDLTRLTEKKVLVREKFKGGYSLTKEGYAVMRDCLRASSGESSMDDA